MKKQQFPKILLLSGTPGTGKSTIAHVLEDRYKWKVFDFGNYIIEKGFYISNDVSRNTKIINTDLAAFKGFIEVIRLGFQNYNMIEDASKPMIEENIIIVDSHYADIIIDGIEQYLENQEQNFNEIKLADKRDIINMTISLFNKNQNIISIIIRCEPKELQNRLNRRSYSEQKILENVQAEILGESTTNMLEVLKSKSIFEIDTAKNTEEETANIIYKIIKDPEMYSEEFGIGKINWMEKLSLNGTLNDYFTDELGQKKILYYDEKNQIVKSIEEKKEE